MENRIEYWAKRNKCTTMSQEDSFDGKVHHLSWTCQGKDGIVQHYKIDDMGMFSSVVQNQLHSSS